MPRGGLKGVRTVHLGGDDSAGQDTATDGDHSGEGALLVDVGALNGGLGRAEAQTNILIPSPGAGVLAGTSGLVVQEDVRLRVVSACETSTCDAADASGSTCFWKARSDWTLFLNQHAAWLQHCRDVRELGGHGCGRVLSVCWSVGVVMAVENRSGGY